jgi:hypothetical protein
MLLIISIIFGAGLSTFLPDLKDNFLLIKSRLLDPQITEISDFFSRVRISGDYSSSVDERNSYKKAQESIPIGNMILARTEKPFLFDLKRNEVFIIDLPGGASLPPGMPSFKGGEALAQYFLSKNIRYIIYSYATECDSSQAVYGDYEASATNIWIKTSIKVTFDFNHNLRELGLSRKRIFDDGKIYALDLAVTK